MRDRLKSIELFTGLGGLALGVHRANFEHLALVEWSHAACEAIRLNQRRGASETREWPLFETDVRRFNFRPYVDRVDLLAAGAPCQPFSIAGRRLGHLDARDMFPEVFRAMREMQPKAVIVENVRGLAGRTLAEYFRYIVLRMAHPEHDPRPGETVAEHLRRLEDHDVRSAWRGLRYKVFHKVLNAADYGVPQRRERLFIVAFREDLEVDWVFPPPTHTFERLTWDQFVTHDYWTRHGIPRRRPADLDPGAERLAARMRGRLLAPEASPWRTVRDAIFDLDGAEDIKSLTVAKSYPGHTGSDWDLPSKTLKAGVHGIPGGENSLRLDDNHIRYFTVREAARLQTFPDDFLVPGALTRAHALLGNAVPVQLARVVAESVARVLGGVVADDLRQAI